MVVGKIVAVLEVVADDFERHGFISRKGTRNHSGALRLILWHRLSLSLYPIGIEGREPRGRSSSDRSPDAAIALARWRNPGRKTERPLTHFADAPCRMRTRNSTIGDAKAES